MAEDGLFSGISSADNKKTKQRIAFFSGRNVFSSRNVGQRSAIKDGRVFLTAIKVLESICKFLSAWPSHLARLASAISKWLCSFHPLIFLFSIYLFYYIFWARIKIVVVVLDRYKFSKFIETGQVL